MSGHRLSRTATLAGLLLAAAAARELRKPPEERTWHGRLAGVVPYDLRWPPTLARVRERWWNPGDPRLFTEHVFGVGWSVNLARLASLVRKGVGGRSSGTTETERAREPGSGADSLA